MNTYKLDDTELLLRFFWERFSTELQCLFDSLWKCIGIPTYRKGKLLSLHPNSCIYCLLRYL